MLQVRKLDIAELKRACEQRQVNGESDDAWRSQRSCEHLAKPGDRAANLGIGPDVRCDHFGGSERCPCRRQVARRNLGAGPGAKQVCEADLIPQIAQQGFTGTQRFARIAKTAPLREKLAS